MPQRLRRIHLPHSPGRRDRESDCAPRRRSARALPGSLGCARPAPVGCSLGHGVQGRAAHRPATPPFVNGSPTERQGSPTVVSAAAPDRIKVIWHRSGVNPLNKDITPCHHATSLPAVASGLAPSASRGTARTYQRGRTCAPEKLDTREGWRCSNVLLIMLRHPRVPAGELSDSAPHGGPRHRWRPDRCPVSFPRCRDRRESISLAATGSLPGAQNPPGAAQSRHEIRLGGPEPILPMGERSGYCEAGYLCPLAPSGIPSLLALEVSPRWSSTPTQEPACTHRDNGTGESELGRRTDRR